MNESAHSLQGTSMPGTSAAASNGSVFPWCPELRDENEDKTYKQFYENARLVTGLFLYPSICFPGLLCNALSVYVLTRRNMLSSTNAFLSALAVADSIKLLNDILYFLVIVFMNTSPKLGNLSYGYLYPYTHFVFNMSLCVSSWLTVSVAVERYILVCHATKARAVWSRRMAVTMCSVIYVAMTCLALPSALRYRTIRCMDRSTNVTRLEVELTEMWQNKTFVIVYTWIQNLMRSIIPLIVLIILNTCIICALRKTRTKRRQSSRHRVTVMMIVVILTFLVCITPDAILSTIFEFGYHEAGYLAKGIREITDTLLGVNAGVNFLIYCAFNKVFRRCFTRLCCPQVRQTGWVTEMDETTYRRLSEAKSALLSNNNSPPRHGTLSRCPTDKRVSSLSLSPSPAHHCKHTRRGEHQLPDKRQDSSESEPKACSYSPTNGKGDPSDTGLLCHNECEERKASSLMNGCKTTALGSGLSHSKCSKNCKDRPTQQSNSLLNGLTSGSYSLPELPQVSGSEETDIDQHADPEHAQTEPLLNHLDHQRKSYSQPQLYPLTDKYALSTCSCSKLRSETYQLTQPSPNKSLPHQKNTNEPSMSEKLMLNGQCLERQRGDPARAKRHHPHSKTRHRPSSNGLKKSKNSVKSKRAKRKCSYAPAACSDSECTLSESSSTAQAASQDVVNSSYSDISQTAAPPKDSHYGSGGGGKAEKRSKLFKFVPPCIDGFRKTCTGLEVTRLHAKRTHAAENGLSSLKNCDGSSLASNENNNGSSTPLSKPLPPPETHHRPCVLAASTPAFAGRHKHGRGGGHCVRFKDVQT